MVSATALCAWDRVLPAGVRAASQAASRSGSTRGVLLASQTAKGAASLLLTVPHTPRRNRSGDHAARLHYCRPERMDIALQLAFIKAILLAEKANACTPVHPLDETQSFARGNAGNVEDGRRDRSDESAARTGGS
jgi:hypothetical protein